MSGRFWKQKEKRKKKKRTAQLRAWETLMISKSLGVSHVQANSSSKKKNLKPTIRWSWVSVCLPSTLVQLGVAELNRSPSIFQLPNQNQNQNQTQTQTLFDLNP